MNKNLSALSDINLWCSLNIEEQDKIVSILRELLEKEFEYLYIRNYTNNPRFRIPTFRHISSNIEMNLIIGGTFEMGLSTEEEKQAIKISDPLPFDPDSMRPAHSVIIEPFLAGRFPILETFAVQYVEIDEDLFRPEFGDFGEPIPIYLNQNELNLLLNKFNLNIPSEAEWEYAYRGKTKTLFYFGEFLPDEDILEEQVLLYNFKDEATNLKAANPFGLVGMQVGEWCLDNFTESYKPLYSKKHNTNIKAHVVRGGAAPLYPWQNGDEWSLCISAMRRSSDELEDETCGARFVKPLQGISSIT